MSRKRRGPAPFGVLAVHKPAGPTSHDIVAWVRWGLGTREAGHCGTLDPAATGLLLVCVGGATRLVQLLTAEDKTYDATFVLGSETDTLDAEGEVTRRAPVDDDAVERARACVEGLRGAHALPPPAYSAVKVDGVGEVPFFGDLRMPTSCDGPATFSFFGDLRIVLGDAYVEI